MLALKEDIKQKSLLDKLFNPVRTKELVSFKMPTIALKISEKNYFVTNYSLQLLIHNNSLYNL